MLSLGNSLARVHLDMAKTLEVAQKYSEAKVEYENGLGMLHHMCRASANAVRIKRATADIRRMDRALDVAEDRKRHAAELEGAYAKLDRACDPVERESARWNVLSSLKRCLRTKRDSLGEGSYAHAKLRLKLAKVRCEGGDIDGGMRDATAATLTLRSVLGMDHTL